MVHDHMSWQLKLYKFFMLKIKGTKIGMLLLKRKLEMCLMPVLAPIVRRMTQMSFLRTFYTLSLVMMLVG